MSESQPFACPEPFRNGRYCRYGFKEKCHMQDDGNTMLTRQDGGDGQSADGRFEQTHRIATSTLTHAVCYERNLTGTGLTHRPRYERPHRLQRAKVMY